jgi:hypothetical protein
MNLKLFDLNFVKSDNEFYSGKSKLIAGYEKKMSYNCMELNIALHFSKLYENEAQKALAFQILKRAFDKKLEFLIMYFKLFIKVRQVVRDFNLKYSLLYPLLIKQFKDLPSFEIPATSKSKQTINKFNKKISFPI